MHWSPGGAVAPEAIAAWTEAARLYQKTLETDPSDASLRARLGGVLVDAGQADAGVAELRRAARARPGDAFVQGSLADALDDLGRAEEAQAQYRVAAAAQRRLTQANPRHAGHHARLAELLNEVGEEGDDEAWLDGLLLDPDYPGVAEIVLEHGDEGGQTLAARRWQEAAEGFRATVEQWPPVAAHALCGLGEALAHLGQPAAARKALERALALRPGWWRPLESLVELGSTD
jgi:tetratricopeptide (TPR) repeat protein